jgi:hypothetical protein
MTVLGPGVRFPMLTVRPPAARAVDVPAQIEGHFAVVLFYRGHGAPTAMPSCAHSSGLCCVDLTGCVSGRGVSWRRASEAVSEGCEGEERPRRGAVRVLRQ